MTEKRMAMAVATMQKELSDRAEALGGNAVANLKVDYETIGSMNVTIIATADAVKMKSAPKDNPPKSKLKKAEKVYKSFNGRDPRSMKTETIDVGDVWVHLGKGWSLGYNNGKETGDDSQKYIHNFGENDSGNASTALPDLYLAMSDKGKPLLVIRGGAWKVKTDEDGVSWLYD